MSWMDDAVVLDPVSHQRGYDPPEKYKGRTSHRGQMVGTRIDPKTELGAELAKLRTNWKAAAAIGLAEREEMDRRMRDISTNVPISLDAHFNKQWREQREKVIRKKINDVIQSCIDANGRPPDTIGIPAESLDEVREACWDYDVTFVLEEA